VNVRIAVKNNNKGIIMLETVIFDMDGVIVDSEPFHYQIEGIIFKELGLKLSESERSSFVGLSNESMWSYIKDKYHLEKPVRSLLEYDDSIRTDYFKSLENILPISGIPVLLYDLYQNGIKITLASSSSIDIINTMLHKLNLAHYFIEVVSGDFVEHGKPHPDIFLHTARLLNSDAKNCIVIEDSKNGVLAAKAAKMKCIGFADQGSKSQDLSKADIIINDFNNLSCDKIKKVLD